MGKGPDDTLRMRKVMLIWSNCAWSNALFSLNEAHVFLWRNEEKNIDSCFISPLNHMFTNLECALSLCNSHGRVNVMCPKETYSHVTGQIDTTYCHYIERCKSNADCLG